MPAPEMLTVSDTGGSDSISLRAASDPGIMVCQIINRNVGRSTSDDANAEFWMSKSEARQLFNWLGVFLHT